MAMARTRWAAVGALVAVAVGTGTLALVNADSNTTSAFVPIAPCRLLDTRSTSTVGPRSTPITAGESLTVQVVGSNGQCTIPATATAIVINVTALAPSANGYMSLYPADVALPNASNLNYVAGQKPRANLVTVSLSAAGAIKIFNSAGTVNVLGDIAGYYESDNGTAKEGTLCTAGGLPGIIVNGIDHDHNVSSKCFTNMVSTLAGSGTFSLVDGQGIAASFKFPYAVAVDRTDIQLEFLGIRKKVRVFANCTAARAAGVTPIRRSTNPALYKANRGLDRDGDGVACES